MRIGIVGGGIAGTLLAWRLTQLAPAVKVEIWTGDPSTADASATSGGMVRGFDTDPLACRLATESLAEIRASRTLRDWTDYREIGSLYLLPPGVDAGTAAVAVDRRLPGSVTLSGGRSLAHRYGLRDLPENSTGVAERHAGFISPARLRDAVLHALARVGVRIHRLPAAAVDPHPAVRLRDGTVRGYDAVVVAAGAGTPRLLADSGQVVDGLRTKQIQYGIHPARLPGLGAFVDDTTGLYGRPAGAGEFLLGLPTEQWDVDPDQVTPDPALAARVTACGSRRFTGRVGAPQPQRLVAAADCYHPRPGLALRACGAALFTFTGGSGGAAKTVVAASRTAAASLLGT